MNKTSTISIRVSKEDLDILRQAARLEAYSSYSEFIRRTSLLEAKKIIQENKQTQERMHSEVNNV